METATPQLAPHATEASDLLHSLGVGAASGLAEEEVERRRRRHGPNLIAAPVPVSALTLLLRQFRSPVVWLLLAAAALAFAFDETLEGIAIAAVLAINTLIGFITEIRAVRSIEGLRALGQRRARVRRDGQVRSIAAQELVPGDIVLIEGGEAISADLRILDASHLGIDESVLTGESVPVDKDAAPVAAVARIAERSCMLFKGTLAVRGSATGIVVGTGADTELGRISRLATEARPEHSPLELRLASLSGQLIRVVAVLAAILAMLGIWSGQRPFLMVKAAIALAVAAIPEGLPVVATLALARGMWRMARRNALVERLSAVETLGGTTVILTDKTGTLTENRMTVRRLRVHSHEFETDPVRPVADDLSRRLLEVAVLCNDAALGDDPQREASGDPMEIALLRAGASAGIVQRELAASRPV